MSHQVLVNMSSIPHPTAKVADTLCIMHDTHIDGFMALQLFVHALCCCLSTYWSFGCHNRLSFPGYGFYRPQMTLFDPGWRGEQTKGPEDSEWGVVDLGNDPTTIVERFCCPCHIMLLCLPLDYARVH